MDTRVHLPSFPSIHRIGAKHKATNNNGAANTNDDDNTGNNNHGKSSTSVNKNVPSQSISRTVSSANRDSGEKSYLRLSEKLRHSTNGSGLGGKLSSASMELGSGSGSVIGNTIGSSSGTNIGLLRSPKSRISSKSSGFSVTVDLPTIRPSAGVYSPKLQKNLSRINTLFGDENDRRSDSDSSRSSSQTSSGGSESYSSSGSDSEEKTSKIATEHFSDNPSKSGINESNIPNITENVEGEFEAEKHNESRVGDGEINENVVRIKQLSQGSETLADQDPQFIYKHNTEAINKDKDINKLSIGQSPEVFTDVQEQKQTDYGYDYENNNSNTHPHKSPDFFISEANSLLNHRIKLMDDLHMSPTAADPVSTFIPAESDSVDPSENSVNGRSMSPDITPQPQLMVPSQSDYSVLTNMPNGKNNSLSLNRNKRNTLSSSNKPLEMNQVLFEKHPTMSMKHYSKIMNRAKHVGAYLTTYYAYIQEYQKIHHPRENSADTMYPSVEGVWNPLQIMRNRRVRMRTGEKLKKLTMHGQKVGVSGLYSLNDSLTNLTCVTTTSLPLPLGVVTSWHSATENAGLGILSAEASNFFHHDWRKVKVASRVFSRHSKQRLIWQIGLHEIIGDLAWREGKWNELRDPSGRRWFPKHSNEASNHKLNSGANSNHMNNSRSEDSKDGSDDSEHKIRKIHDLLFVDDGATGEGREVDRDRDRDLGLDLQRAIKKLDKQKTPLKRKSRLNQEIKTGIQIGREKRSKIWIKIMTKRKIKRKKRIELDH
ncbi:hypothetical protein PICMEDRAFT_68736 [Pichia membranifaciens NRRL Y-2026]|uniref:Uncharacterized protein n=1 Tax=Pichia membranifaciens NRRL Y-2026 TaxID=763406 RepID=A0A1E3NIU3_9ASCO|nr:hypothetical protein PICMEDRAFT_68736 [Pichia membranifaciens NRRL Y-2026]ODQ45986.1 hypothetical protein PICMEDRAFT_68736 [Pichia membranifaciens NRRL Y-2026]